MDRSLRENGVGVLLGKTLASVVRQDGDPKTDAEEVVVFTFDSGEVFRMGHMQSCCESVTIEDIVGDLGDLVGSPILMAEEATSEENPPGIDKGEPESFTWTFYKFATIKGYVTIRWYGSSNGFYSESVDLRQDWNCGCAELRSGFQYYCHECGTSISEATNGK